MILEVTSPERKLVKIPCESISLPGSQGEFEVLPGHTPMLATLKPGIITFRRIEHSDEKVLIWDDASELRFMISGGVVEIQEETVEVLCDAATLPSEVNEVSERELLTDLKSKLESLSSSDEKESKILAAKIAVSTARLNLF